MELNMKRTGKSLVMLVGAILFLLLAGMPQAQAAPVIGGIGFGGAWVPNTGNINTATAVDILNGQVVIVTASSGDFLPFATPYATFGTYQDFTFSPSTPVAALWVAGGFTFDLASSSIVSQTATGLVLKGTGTVYGNGFDPTPGTWSFSGDKTGTTFVFSSTTSTEAVPEPTSLLLLGTGVLGLALAGRKLRK
jgi:hypothetical protein